MQFPFDSKKKEKILIHLIFLEIKEVFYNFELKFSKFLFHYSGNIQATTAIVDTVIVESTAIVEQKTLTTQFYLLLVESPL